MNRKTIAIFIIVLAGLLLAGVLVIGRNRSGPAVTVTLRIAVRPTEQSGFVIAQANSARFKYLVGKEAGVKPVLAQKLSARMAPNSSFVEARIGVATKEEARRYVDVFVQTLQGQCGDRAQLALAEESIR
jgi:hypothetical protein